MLHCLKRIAGFWRGKWWRWALSFLMLARLCAAVAQPQPNIILITVDTVRADRMGFLGSKRGLTPNLDALARHSVVFTHAYSQVPITNPSHATILTGTYPQFHHVNDFAIPLAEDLPDLPQILHQHGYHTAAFVAASVLDPKGAAPGFDRGFDSYDAESVGGRRAEAVVEHVLAFLKKQPHCPLFLWVHLYDPHAPYVSPEPFKSRYASAPYDGAIAYADSAIGHLIAQLRAQGLYENSVIAIMSDHGESLGDHGEQRHGYFLYDETIHVPLLIKLPGKGLAEKRVEVRVGLVDVAPTILQIVDLPVPAAMQGQSLVPLTKSTPNAVESLLQRSIYSETDYPYLAYGWSSLRALRSNKYLFIDAPRKELYDQSADAAAEHNLALSSPAVTSEMKFSLDTFRSETGNATNVPEAVTDAEQAKKLNALGYLASIHTSGIPVVDEARADPKDMIEVANRMTLAIENMARRRYADAVPLLEYVVSKDPDNVAGNRVLGEAYVRVHDYSEAVPPLRKALRLGSDLATTHYQLGLALFALKDWNGAEVEFTTAAAKSPRWPDAHYWLGSTYGRLKRYPEAEKELEATIQFQPDNFPANMELGQVLLIEHNPEKASAVFKKAAELEPDMGDPHHFLARAYIALGREDDAQRENAEAARLGLLEKTESKGGGEVKLQ
jgi:arylsulfatase A-like enzyme/Tfp pilus assembly protein PilF